MMVVGSEADAAMTDGRSARDRRRDILDAARREFTARGYDGARMDHIVARADVSKNLAYHYFGSKAGLFTAVIEDVYKRVMASFDVAAIARMDPVDAVEHVVRSVHRAFIDHPEVFPLLNSENLHRASRMAQSAFLRNFENPLLDGLSDILRRGATGGIFKQDVDPRDLYITVCGLCWFHLSNAHTIGVILGEDLFEPERLARREDHVVTVVLAYLESRSSSLRQAGRASGGSRR